MIVNSVVKRDKLISGLVIRVTKAHTPHLISRRRRVRQGEDDLPRGIWLVVDIADRVPVCFDIQDLVCLRNVVAESVFS